MDDNKDIQGGIYIPPKNKMSGLVQIISTGDSVITASIVVHQIDEIDSIIHVYSDEVVIDITYPPLFGNQRKARLFVPYRDEIQASLFITPYNRMSGLVEVVPPPKIERTYTAIKDTFVRSEVPLLNYGELLSAVVGKSDDLSETYHSYIGFDVSDLPENASIEEAKIRIYKNRNTKSNMQIGVYEPANDWTEYGITWASQPPIRNIVSINTVGTDVGYVELDVLSAVRSWYDGESTNNGFLLRTINEQVNDYVQFSTRETITQSPELIVTYRDKTIYSFGRSDIPSNIFVYAVDQSEITASITIKEYESSEDFPAYMKIYNPDMMESRLIINRPFIESNVIIRREEYSDLVSSLFIKQKDLTLLDGRIVVNAPYRQGYIYVPYRDEIPAHLTIKRFGYSVLESGITVSREFIRGYIFVKQVDHSEIAGSFILKKPEEELLESRVTVSKKFIHAHIKVVLSSYLNASMVVRKPEREDFPSSIIVPYRSNIPASIEVVGASMIEGSVRVLSGYLRSRLVIPEYDQDDKLARMRVRVIWADDLQSKIIVGGDNVAGGYVIII